MTCSKDIFDRTILLMGNDVFNALQKTRVILFGVGGVGSWCAEGLIRSGIGHLTIVDSDTVSVSNINRQLMATTKTVGRPKVEVLRERLLDINPDADITALQEIYSAETAARFQLETYDYVIDAIDSLSNKVQLILHATSLDVQFFSAMGAALKVDPSKIHTGEFWEIKYCPLARMLRKRFKNLNQYPSKKFQCVYSPEVLPNIGAASNTETENCQEDNMDEKTAEVSTWDLRKAQTNGSLAHITAIFGFTLAGLVIEEIYKLKVNS
ncbi:MAG: tRNA threonylcarbamoyladenosine dehydratase [Bacteroidales bacterium]|nr:tRNA threonylcarbamoyladenosine dehydratase [Bacteroidales bacterium]